MAFSEETQSIINSILPAIRELADLLNSDCDYADDACDTFAGQLNEHIEEMGEDEFCQYHDDGMTGYALAEMVDNSAIGNSFMVDWKDRESAIALLADAMDYDDISLTFDYGTDDPENNLAVHQIFVRSNLQLNTIGWYLLGFETGADNYREILLPASLLDEFLDIMNILGVEIDMNDEECAEF
ncbi:DUF6630 family protein [Morganella morganii]|uniref:DUF6630 family protein n=1 Tax=Morganella morganii TaxID=582 RepID=UPI001BDAF508|nr:hypothetical protein [Morganella morganii]MBT0383117.1 hypothetical protein [Morganella morganii subsp. morganii]